MATTKVKATKIVTKAPTVTLPITTGAEFKRALAVVLSQDGKRESSAWTYPRLPGVNAFLALPPRGTHSSTIQRIAPKLGGFLGFLGRRGVLAVPAPVKGEFLGPVSPMKTLADVEQTANYYILTGGVIGLSLDGWEMWLADNHTDAVVMPRQDTPTTALSGLAEKMGGGHVDTAVTPKLGGRPRAAIVVGVAWTP